MRTLVVTHVRPWPAVSGTTIRMSETIAALAEMGPVDLVCVLGAEGHTDGLADAPGVDRVLLTPRPPPARGARHRVSWLRGDRPWSLHRDYSNVREAIASFAGDHDLLWLGRIEGFLVAAPVARGPIVCDFDDLEDVKLAARIAATPAGRSLRTLVSNTAAELDRRRWRRLEEQIAARSHSVLVCSETDRARLALANAAVVPNAYPAPAGPLGRERPGTPPTVSMIGLLTYEPNVDAARFMVEAVLPRLRDHHADVQVRLVGRHDHRLVELASVPGVHLTGFVDDLDTELATADVLVSPVLFGGGTRVKILEAFAHRIPVVSTTLGAEGLDVVHGRHLLLADDARSFAERCAALLGPESVERRRDLTEQAWVHWSERFRPEHLHRAVTGVATSALRPPG